MTTHDWLTLKDTQKCKCKCICLKIIWNYVWMYIAYCPTLQIMFYSEVPDEFIGASQERVFRGKEWGTIVAKFATRGFRSPLTRGTFDTINFILIRIVANKHFEHQTLSIFPETHPPSIKIFSWFHFPLLEFFSHPYDALTLFYL